MNQQKAAKWLLVTNFITLLLLITVSVYYKLPEKLITRLGLLSEKSSVVDNKYENNPDYVARRSLFNVYRPKQISIVMLGDSLTYEADWNELLSRSDVINRGISRDITEGFINRLDDVRRFKPDKCLIMGGINDIGRGIPLSNTIANIKLIVEDMKANNIKPIIQSTLFIAATHPDWKEINEKVDQLNRQLKEYAIENDIVYVDINAALSEKGALNAVYTYDGVHLLGNGYAIWRDLILPLL